MTDTSRIVAGTAVSEQPARLLQPLLHTLVSSVAAPAMMLSERDGQIRGEGVCGWFVDDVRLLSRVELRLQGSALDLVSATVTGAQHSAFVYVARGLGDSQPDPTVFVDRARKLTPSHLIEEFVISSTATGRVDVVVHLDLGSDLSSLHDVKNGGSAEQVSPQISADGLVWARNGIGARAKVVPTPQSQDPGGTLSWEMSLVRGDAHSIRVECEPCWTEDTQFRAGDPAPWSPLRISAADRRLEHLLEQGAADLEGLLLRDGSTQDQFLAAGAPWFLTLFGRDSLWAARMMLPLGTQLALSTLRTLARRQGQRQNSRSEEEPGKILHEVRAGPIDVGAAGLPPLYYGTVDATPLFGVALAEAWRWGAEPSKVEDLLPTLRRCLHWMMEKSRSSGWLQYLDVSGRGLVNQGWKDSADAVQFADGELAQAPIALSEVQAYAYQAAVEGARLLEAFSQPAVVGLDAWAADLRTRFHRNFWVSDDDGDFPAIALDRSGTRVDSRASNMGHLLGTGLLDESHARAVATALAAPEMDSGFGLRTLSVASPAFSRLSYHGGTVWPHDTAIAAMGLAAEGFRHQAAELARGMIRASEAFGYRLPELYGGDSSADVQVPSAYPAACRPQAWAAAAPLATVMAVSGMRVDVPRGTITHPAYTSTRLGALELSGLRVGEHDLALAIASDGAVTVQTEAPLEVVVEQDLH